MDHPLIRWRQRDGLSQMALAFQCEVSQSVISACERYQGQEKASCDTMP